MIRSIDGTHAVDLVSWVDSALAPGTDFPIQNLPLGMFRAREHALRPGIAIGDSILDLGACADLGLLSVEHALLVAECGDAECLNPLIAKGPGVLSALRSAASDMLRADTRAGRRARELGPDILVDACDAELQMPVRVGDYTDFYASIHHATNVGSMFRPDNPLLPNYKWVPIGYHGRASSIVPSGAAIRRPHGQTKEDSAPAPTFGPTRRLDYELEIGAVIGAASSQGATVPLRNAESHIAGLCLVNDWSARDVQSWEYQPLGPFLAKNFATTVSPWIVTLDALAPYRTGAFHRAPTDPQPLPYLTDASNESAGAFDITLEVQLTSQRMRKEGIAPFTVSAGSFTSMYWTIAQLVAHHASNGCNLQPGDLIASGTVSGTTKESRGCMLERTWRGTEPLTLPTGETRKFLEDGDEVIMRGWCERDGFRRIGFGECRGVVLPAV